MSASNEETSSPVVAPNDVKIDVEDPVEESEAPIKEPSAPVKENEVPLKEASGPVKEVENEKPIDQDEDDEEPPNIMKDLLPWIVTAGIGVILLIAAVIVMATRKEQTFRFPYTTEEFNIPDYLGSVRVKSVGGQDLRYISELRQIGSPASRATRYKLEPQLEYIYGNASLPVDNVVVIAFKYGASNTLASRTRRSVSGRSGNDGNEHSVVAKHWLYLKKNITKSTEDLQTDFVAALSKVPGIVVDETSIKLESLENMTKAQAIVALAQAGFFSKKYGQLDQELLDIFGLNPIIDIQTDDDDEEGLCRSLSHPSNGKVYPQACTTSISTYAKMACSFTCDPGFDLEGSPNRICMGSGLWSGEPVKCHKKCPPLEHSTVGSITPQSCSHANSSSGQLCFTECPSENYQMIFPSPTTVEKKLDMPGADLFDFNNYALKEDAVDPLDDVRTYLQRCGSDGEWNGIVGTCKTKCATLVPPENGVVEPSTCVSNPLEGDECSVSCSPGFAMADGADYKLLTCEVTGTWTGEISPCHESCPMHSTNNSVNVSPLICMSSTYEGLSCKYSCDAGNSLVGASKRTCHGGTWDAEEPTCVQLCEALPNPENGVFMTTAGPCSDVTLLEGTECIVHCDTGSRAVENSTVCLPSGQWSRENITCEKMCRPLVPDRYGDWTPATCTGAHFAEPGACSLSCSLGFQLTGPGTVTCAGDGTWDTVQGQCEANCPGLTAPTNGYLERDSCVDGSTVVGSTCEFSCRPSFRINGDRVLTCEAGWSASAPTCTLEEQFHIVQEVGGKVTCLLAEKDGSLRKVEEVVGDEDRCVSNYASWIWQNDNIVHAVHRTCLVADSGWLLFHLATCEPSDGMQKFTGDLGNTVKVKDENIYMTSGYRTVLQPQQASDIQSFMEEKLQWRFQNTASGVGMNLYGLSEMRQCPPLVLDSSVTITNAACGNMAQNNGTLCAIECSGSTLSDRSSAQADVECIDGEWLVDLDVYCVPASTERCSGLSLGSGVTVTPTSCGSTSNAGTTCEMQCSDPTLYNLDGPVTVQCLDSGRWSPRGMPACRKRCQSLLPLPDNSYLISGDSNGCTANDGLPTTGSVCAYGCHDGFAAMGQSILTCMADGEWSAPAPECVQLCDPLENIDHGNIGNCSAPMHMGKYTENTKCVFTCEPGYMPDVSITTISCRGAAWNMESVGSLTCVPVCQGFAVQPHTWVSDDCRSHLVAAGTQCTFTCEDGYGLNTHMMTYMTSLTRTCQADGSWTGSIATCSRRCPAFAEPDMHGAYFDRPECQSLPQRPHSQCLLKCPGGFDIHDGPETLTCGEDGAWSHGGTFGSCSRVCEALPDVPYGVITPKICTEGFVKTDTECIISCHSNMERVGSALRKCVEDETTARGSRWTGTTAPTECMARCKPLVPLPYSLIFPTNCQLDSKVAGDTCSFECDPGYLLDGSPELRCLESGKYSDMEPSCFMPCQVITVPNGEIVCDDSYGLVADGLGYVYKPGAKCNYFCKTGFAANQNNQVTCGNGGIWLPEPFCSPISDAFPIIQKIEGEMVCLTVSATGNDGTMDGSDWHLTTTENSTTGCQDAGNNAMWFWYGKDHIKHAQTGLCLTAEAAMADSLIYMQYCDISNPLQMWTCDAEHSYRFILKDTVLSIDTLYWDFGPLLQSGTHSQTYWITYNSLLEAVGTICSYKVLGACPPINKKSMKATPAVCMGDEVEIWQQCAVSCEDNADFDGATSTVECQPTGEWKNLDLLFCRDHCPALPDIPNGSYDKTGCTTESKKHQSECKLICDDGYVLSNNLAYQGYLCTDGLWNGDMDVSCQDRCVVVPKAPENGKVTCVAKSCTVACNLGYKLSGGSATFQCTEGVDYVEDRGIVCEEEFQFQIKSESAVYSAMIPHCITAMLKDGTSYAVKTPCVSSDLNQFWRWEDSREGTMYSKLQNIGTGQCLSAVSNSSILVLNKCHRQDDLQQWSCHDYLNPGKFGLVSKPRTYVDVGSTHPGTPLLLREDDLHMDSAKWVAHDFYGNLGFVCASRDSGSCPHPTLGTTTASHFDICNLHKAAPPDTKCDLLCYNSSYAFPDGETKHVIECKGGTWDHTARCIATETFMSCDPVTIPRHGIVTPAQCDENNGGIIYRGTVCSFTCEPGYILNGTTEMLCEDTRTMSGTPHQCLEYCPGLTYTSGVKVVDPACSSIAVLSGEACVLECDDGYVPADGAPSAWSKKCGSDGTWSGQDYFCVATCPKLSSSPYNATSDERQIATASLHRSSVTSTQCADSVSLSTTTCEFSCPVGDYVLQGPSAIRCESDGQWTESPPKCESVPHCPKLSASFLDAKYSPEPKDEDVSVPLDTVAKLSCQSGRVLKGDSVRKCRSDGTWSGDVDSDCALECPHLEALYGYTVQPPQCTTQTASHGTTCEYSCPDENDEFSENVACLNGAWGELTKRCYDTQERYEVTNNADEFMLITHNPDGCLFVDDTDTVFWREKDACDPSQLANKWKWVEGHRISTARENLCLQPVDDSKQTTSLGVGNCVTAFRVGCGSPESAYRKYFLYAFSNPKWRMSYSIPTAASSMSVTMVKTEFTDSDVDPDSLEGIEVFANTNADNPRTTDRTVCSYMCGGVISPGQDSTTRAIMTPGFVEGEGYLVNSYCEWTFNSLGKVLVLRLQEIDINSSVKKECSPDCVQIFEGNAEGGVVSEHLTTYSGRDIYKQGSLEIKSASPSVTVAFTGISGGPGRGFSMMYHFEDLPASSTDCGTRQQYDAIASNSSSSVVDEVAEYRGQSAVATKWPWLVSVREIERGSLRVCTLAIASLDWKRIKFRRVQAHHRCTGVLIGAQVVLSAAHCVRFALASSTSQIHVGVGFVLQNEMDHEMRTHAASHPMYHIYYGYDSLTRYGDIALFNLREPVSMSDSVFPICMPSLGYKVHLPTSQCYSAGWSSPATGTRLNHIMDYKVDVHSSSWCKERLGLNDDVSFACVENVYVDGSGKNEKDESDPLMCYFDGNWYVAGVRSYTHVGARGTYRMYTEIHKFKDWILDTSDKIYLFDNSQGSSLL